MPRKPQSEIEKFATGWVAAHFQDVRGAQSVEAVEVGRLSAEITRDARAEGISGSDLHGVLGNIDDYLASEFEKILEPRPDAQSALS